MKKVGFQSKTSKFLSFFVFFSQKKIENRNVFTTKRDGLRRRFGTRLQRQRRAKLLCCESFGTSRPALNCAEITADAVTALWGYAVTALWHRPEGILTYSSYIPLAIALGST
jgi:hypothetical protein